MDKKNTENKQKKKVTRKDLSQYLSWISKNQAKLLDHFPRLSFAEQLGILLFTSGSLRQQLITSSPMAVQLVRALPEPEVFVTLKEIGFSDAHPLISLMTSSQLHYVGDLELWRAGTFCPFRAIEFMKHLYQCGEDTLAGWLDTADPELIVRLLQEYGSVSKFDVYQDPVESSDEQGGAITHEGYYRFHLTEDEVRPLLDATLRILSERNPPKYARILESVYQDPRTEVEEEATKWREARLVEQGIPAFEEACEIYRYLSDEEFFSITSRVPLPETPAVSGPVMYPVRWLPRDSFIRDVLRELADGPEVDRIRWELAAIANKVIIADGTDIGDTEMLKVALGKVAGYLTIALSYLTKNDVRDAAAWMSRTWIHFLFRLGYSRIYTLTQRARQVRPRMSFRWINLTLYLPDSPMEETVRGLLRSRPLFFEGQSSENFLGYRDFASMHDVTTAERRLASVEFLTEYFDKDLSLPPETIKTSCLTGAMGDRLDPVKWSNVLATVWVRSLLHRDYVFKPLAPEEVCEFVQTISGTAKTRKRRLTHTRKASAFLKWLEGRISQDKGIGQELLSDLFLRAVSGVEDELEGLDPKQPIDSRYLKSLCISSLEN